MVVIIQMRLFDDIEVPKNRKHSSSDYELICSSNKSHTIKCRELIEHWFDQFPKDNLNEFLGRFKSKSSEHHAGALFELFVYNLCLSLGFQTTRNTIGKIPDFKIITSTGETIFLECTMSGDSISKDPVHKNSNRLYEKLNEENLKYWISIEIERAGPNPIPEGKLLRIIKGKVNLLDNEQELLNAKNQNFSEEQLIIVDDWEIQVSFRAKPTEIFIESTDNIGLFSGGLMSIETPKYLIQALNDKKTSNYDVYEMPYIIALNSLEIGLTEYEFLKALIGNTNESGFFNENKNTSVSGVLLTKRLNSWNVLEPNLTLYHNPWTKKPINENIFNLNQVRIEFTNGSFKLIRKEGLDGVALIKNMV